MNIYAFQYEHLEMIACPYLVKQSVWLIYHLEPLTDEGIKCESQSLLQKRENKMLEAIDQQIPAQNRQGRTLLARCAH